MFLLLQGMAISFHTADLKFTLKQKLKLKQFISAQLQASNFPIFNLSIIFTSDEYLRAINKQFLNHDYYTDIITFPLSENEQSLDGEIYISIDRVSENGLRFAVDISQRRTHKSIANPKSAIRISQFETELHRVMFHGVLHLLGYKDKTRAQQAEMRKMEDKWLKDFVKYLNK